MLQDRRDETLPELRHRTFDDALGRRIVDTHIWAVREGLRGADAYHLFDGYCQRLVIDGIPLWRAHAAMETLHPQWNGYGYTWRRDLNAIAPEITPTATRTSRALSGALSTRSCSAPEAGEDNPEMRRRIERSGAARLPDSGGVLRAGATDYFAQLFVYGERRRPLAGNRHRLFVHDRSQGRIQR